MLFSRKENIFKCLVVLLKMLQKTHFYHVSHIFLRSKQILLHRIKIYKQHKKQKSKQKHHLFTNLVRGGRKSERLRERENRSGWRRRRLDRVGLGVEWNGLVVGGGQIRDRWWWPVCWRAWWSIACSRLSRSELVGAWLAIGEVDR